ncbi:MAG: ribosomal-processing cysteine protease Prp [Treponema sp.]|nr:ribosomal-processing cysteine protease Prp [Treponema sp.]
MIVVALSYGKNGALKKCKANGHAHFSRKGTDIVCSAVTTLVRTAAQVLSHNENVSLNFEAPERGSMSFSIEAKTESLETETQLKCIGDFLRTGILALTKEFPKNVILMEE